MVVGATFRDVALTLEKKVQRLSTGFSPIKRHQVFLYSFQASASKNPSDSKRYLLSFLNAEALITIPRFRALIIFFVI